ncbi:sulfate permease 2 [Nannizzia gypsea CBS 118893]|uniref:Sulfate permease 2 n=1 Tax=Arthroderma gypseum (strain ATCC MYA-4604 / CBS 118893) TaxID=535722 RepID=E4UWC3_ARTGP|nr:sulfate permease 2 [Nannizzia gypsea CBS 118893]EFR02518.1 sulfate permease 2 [Nannizzia gypsea CBS 118893]
MSASKLGRALAKGVGIDVDYRKEPRESMRTAAESIRSLEHFDEDEPSAKEWLMNHRPTAKGAVDYLNSLFPFWNWIFHYNTQWLMGDIIAGVTVGFVVVPQGMAYALLARLPPEYGLYTSFVGFILYWAFATSKDITIGTVAVMSTIVGNIVTKVQAKEPDISAPTIARALSLIAGGFLLFIGLTRLGWIVEFIPLVAITSFMTGAAISIAVGQIPAMMGLREVNNRESTYKVFINVLKNLGHTRLDAAMGLSALVVLYVVRFFCNYMSQRQPNRRKMWFFISTLRMTFVILLYTMISWLVNRNVTDYKKAKFKISRDLFQRIEGRLVKALLPPDLPATIIVLIIEHIAISKSFGRINNYVINPSPGARRYGILHIFGPFLGDYPATGSFSRAAIKSKAGVRTPLAGIFTAVIVLLALYALTSVFFYIPLASLSGLIIHAVGDLITPPNVVYQFWEVSPLEVFIFFGGVLLTIFTEIENGIYLTIAASAGLLIYRIAKAKGTFLGQVKVYRVTKDDSLRKSDRFGEDTKLTSRDAFLPVEHQDGSNPQIEAQSPHPGVFIYRFNEGFTYPNEGRYLHNLTEYIFKVTRRTQLDAFAKLGDRPWNDPGPRRGEVINVQDTRPILRAVILDFSSVNHVDVSSIQGLIDVRNQLDRYAAPEIVEWHFACISNRWTKRALASAGFGYPSPKAPELLGNWRPIFSVAAVGAEEVVNDKSGTSHRANASSNPTAPSDDLEIGQAPSSDDGEYEDEKTRGQITVTHVNNVSNSLPRRVANVHSINRPFFHIDIQAAVESTLLNIETKTASAKNSTTPSITKGFVE